MKKFTLIALTFLALFGGNYGNAARGVSIMERGVGDPIPAGPHEIAINGPLPNLGALETLVANKLNDLDNAGPSRFLNPLGSDHIKLFDDHDRPITNNNAAGILARINAPVAPGGVPGHRFVVIAVQLMPGVWIRGVDGAPDFQIV
jgi:hypothetical protein